MDDVRKPGPSAPFAAQLAPIAGLLFLACRTDPEPPKPDDTAVVTDTAADSVEESPADSDSPPDTDSPVVYGEPLDEVADAKLLGESAGDAYNTYPLLSVSGGCDANGDGLDDIVVGMAGNQAGGPFRSGAAYVVFGPATGVEGLSEADARWLGTDADGAGASVACVGDTNGDGFGDVAVSEPYYDDGEDWILARTYLFLGPPPASGVMADANAVITGEPHREAGEWGARWVAPAGDVNGDGFADVLLSQHDLPMYGTVYLLNGPISPEVDLATGADFTLRGTSTTPYLGFWIASAGDLNADGFDDVLATHLGGGAYAEGRTALYFGPLVGEAVDSDADAWLDTSETAWGYKPEGAGDLDADGYDDIAVDAQIADATEVSGTGAAYVFSGPLSGAISVSYATAKLEGMQVLEGAGAVVAGLGDVNADGFGDLAVAIQGVEYINGPGSTCVVFGPIVGVHTLTEANACFHGDGDDISGWQLSRAGDVDGDGLNDLLIGGAGDDDAGTDAGAVWLVGGAAMW